MPTDEVDPAPEPSNLVPRDPVHQAHEYWIESLVVEQGTSSGHMALIRALARILARLDRAAQAMPESPTATIPDEAAHDPE